MLLEGLTKIPELRPVEIFAGSDKFSPKTFQHARVNSVLFQGNTSWACILTGMLLNVDM